MAKLEKDLSGLVGKSVVFIRPYDTGCTMQVSYSPSYPDKAKIETMSAGFACSEVVVNPGEKRIIGYFDKKTELLYLLGNDVSPEGLFSKGFWGSAPAGIDAPTPAWEKGLQPYGALDCFGWRSEGFQRGTKGSGYPVDTTAEGG